MVPGLGWDDPVEVSRTARTPCSADTDHAVVVRRWPRHPRSVGQARREMRKALADWGLAALEDPAALVLSELLTNAVRHARVSPGHVIETRFAQLPDGLRIEVHDASPTPPEPRAPGADACDGRGLVLVAALAEAWGVRARSGPGKAVWATLSLPTPAEADDTGEADRHDE
ncbi:ATP-binding protein [Streptomyces sp. NPDC001780]